MIRPIMLLCCCIFIAFTPAQACDACGCVANNLGFGLMAHYRNNFIRLSYYDIRFHATPKSGHLNTADVFYQTDITGRYSFRKLPRFSLAATLPYVTKVRATEGKKVQTQGIGDARLLASYTVLNNRLVGKNMSLYAEIGGGVSLPCGKYDASLRTKGLPVNFNIGSGTWGAIGQLIMVADATVFGVAMSHTYQWNIPAIGKYQFGNQYSIQFALYKEFVLGRLKLVPYVGGNWEHIAMDKYATGNKVPETGGKGSYGTAALQLKFNKWQAGVSYAVPLAQHYADGVITAERRLAAHLTLIF